jgi:Alginate export
MSATRARNAWCGLALGLLATGVAGAQGSDSDGALSGGDWRGQMRYRLEHVDIDGPLRTATASTLRTRLGFETNTALPFGALVEVEDVHALGAEKFNSTTNGRSDYAVVADPDSTELNQAYLTARGRGMRANVGRQALSFDGERFIGSVDFRQNQQTYDSVFAQGSLSNGSQLTYAYLWQVNRFFGDDHPLGKLDMRTHAVNFAFPRLNGDRFVAYTYLLEFDELAAASTKTFGASYDGGLAVGARRFLYRAEYAYQSEYADNRNSANVWYANAEVGMRFVRQWVVTAGAEIISSEGAVAFQTPLATLHKFNGFADIFAGATPAGGLQDRYLRLYLPVLGSRFTVTAHDFRDDDGDRKYGHELDAELNWRIDSHWLIGLKYADYRADTFAADTRKVWLWVQADL